MISILIYILVVALVVGLIYYVVDALGVPEPLNRIVKVVAMVVGCLIVIMVLLQIGGVDTGLPRLRG
jgi:hypothetical protein